MDCSWTMTFDDEEIPQIERISISMDDSSYTTAISLEFKQQQQQDELPAWSNDDETEEETEEEEYQDEYDLEADEEDDYYDVASREEHHCDDTSNEDFHDSQQEEEEENGGNDFYKRYQVGELLGSGGYGNVYRCSLKGSSRLPYAVKIINIENYDADEIQLLQELIDCPNVTGVIDLFSDESMVYIVMEEMKGGDLLDRMQEMGGSYEEPDAKILIQTLLETVQFCHSRGIVHMDIKPDNILLRSAQDPTDMELADFGLAQRFVDDYGNRIRLTSRIGTIDYWAPEIILQPQDKDDEDYDCVGYDERVDVWSIGVVMYVLLSGYLPFSGGATEDDHILQQICSGRFEFHEPYWNNVSQEAKDLITMMLQVNPDERCSVDEALESPWFQEASTCPRFGTC